MLQDFVHSVNDIPLFCKGCQGVFLHSLKARAPLYPGVPAHPKEPILVSCHKCRQAWIYVAGEFREYSPLPQDHEVCKIVGRSRLQVKDTVYIPGSPCKGVIKSRFRVANQEAFLVIQESGEEVRLTSPANQGPAGEGSLELYRLLPSEVGAVRIGDPVYHVGRERFGIACGFLFGKESKLVVQFEDNSLLLTTLPDERQIPENAQLTQIALGTIQKACPEAMHGIHIEAGQGILYARGETHQLATIHRLRSALLGLEEARGFVELIEVKPTVLVADDLLQDQIFDHLLHPELAIFGIHVQCRNGFAHVQGYCRHEEARQAIYSLLETLQGLRGLQVDLKYRPHDEASDREKVLTVAQALRRNATLKEARIRIFSMKGSIILEGCVGSSLQKNSAALAAMWAGRNFKVDNSLRISKFLNLAPNNPFIKVS
jgi:osmotically-inducible protein OsmY